ncbi:MAG TPA: hypothetical protein VJ890_01455 [Vineibacter sp.]|nr:hypothetical protein [Vineibacter sp.]
MNRARFLSLSLAALASTLVAGGAQARGVKVRSSGSSSGSSTSSGSGSTGNSKSGGTVVVPTGRGGKEDCTLIADPGRRHDCAAKQIGR